MRRQGKRGAGAGCTGKPLQRQGKQGSVARETTALARREEWWPVTAAHTRCAARSARNLSRQAVEARLDGGASRGLSHGALVAGKACGNNPDVGFPVFKSRRSDAGGCDASRATKIPHRQSHRLRLTGMNPLPFTAEVGAQLLRGLGGGRPFEIIGASGSGQRNGVVFVLTHDYTNPEHKTSLVEVPELHRAVVGVGVTGPPNECKPTVCGPAAAPHSTRPLSRCHVT